MSAKRVATGLFGISMIMFASAASAQTATVNGEVKRIDQSAGKISIRHEPIKEFGMDDAMTMVYRVQDPAILKQVKAGDKIKFEADRVNGKFTIKKIEKKK